MIPTQLKFSGLYSYHEAQAIDFEKLMASQLFGIFGPVGSGKSTILEAIVFVLFDRSDRLNKSGDNRYYNMLNLQSNKLEIDFIYRVKKNSDIRYRSYFLAQRKKKDFDKVEVKERQHYEWKDERWVPLAEGDASSILGMTYENFMQTVIIPQGKFREFIDQRPHSRNQMLKELFHLHRFDLGSKTQHLLRKTELVITDLEARLIEIGQISEEEIAAHEEELERMKKNLLREQQRHEFLRETSQTLESVKNLIEQITSTEYELGKLEQQRGAFREREHQLKAYIKAETFFYEKFQVLETTTQEIQRTSESLRDLEAAVSKRELEVGNAIQREELLKKEYQQRDYLRQQCQELESIIQVKESQPKLEELDHRISRMQIRRDELERSREKQQNLITSYETQLSELELHTAQLPVVQEVVHWMQRQVELEEANKRGKATIQDHHQQLTEHMVRKDRLLTSLTWFAVDPGSDFDQAYQQFQKQLRSQSDSVQRDINELKVQEEIAKVASQLKPGQPCLLCGSTEHPQITHSESVAKKLEAKELEFNNLKERERQLQQLNQDVHKVGVQTDALQSSRRQAEAQLAELESKIESHRQSHRWPEYESAELQQLLDKVRYLRGEGEKVVQLRELRRATGERLQTVLTELDKLQHHQQKLLQDRVGLVTTLEQYQSNLSPHAYETELNSTVTQLRDKLNRAQNRYSTLEGSYEDARQRVAELKGHLQLLLGKKESAEDLCRSRRERAAHLNEEIQSLCRSKNFESVGRIQQLIKLKLDTDSEQEAILTYRNQLHSAEVSLHKLQSELRGRTYNEATHLDIQRQRDTLEADLKRQQQECTLLRQRITDWQERRRRSHHINEQLTREKLREANLKELASLFRGSGFVNYASTVLLENLCRVANQRFMKLTQNALSLEINGDNEFTVRDYLNGGRTRLLKTLSGGQVFQASLCLALALAENVKALNQADQSFFFLDEGFGSLDSKSLRVVFDTLKSLRRERRVVGIISHVEELQHEIDVFLTIKKDRQKGSTIHPSWEL